MSATRRIYYIYNMYMCINLFIAVLVCMYVCICMCKYLVIHVCTRLQAIIYVLYIICLHVYVSINIDIGQGLVLQIRKNHTDEHLLRS